MPAISAGSGFKARSVTRLFWRLKYERERVQYGNRQASERNKCKYVWVYKHFFGKLTYIVCYSCHMGATAAKDNTGSRVIAIMTRRHQQTSPVWLLRKWLSIQRHPTRQPFATTSVSASEWAYLEKLTATSMLGQTKINNLSSFLRVYTRKKFTKYLNVNFFTGHAGFWNWGCGNQIWKKFSKKEKNYLNLKLLKVVAAGFNTGRASGNKRKHPNKTMFTLLIVGKKLLKQQWRSIIVLILSFHFNF